MRGVRRAAVFFTAVGLIACSSDDERGGEGWEVSEEWEEPANSGGEDSDDGTDDGVIGGGNGGGGGGDDLPPPPDPEPREPAVYVAVVYDMSGTENACNGVDSGSDIFAVGLESDTGATLGWGSVVVDDLVLAGNEYPNTLVLDGSPPRLGADSCPEEFDFETVVTLGCGGWVAVEFLDASGRPVPLDAEAGQVIRVYEYGSQCSTGTNDDTYDLNVCLDTEGIWNIDDSSCTVQLLVGARGEEAADVTGF